MTCDLWAWTSIFSEIFSHHWRLQPSQNIFKLKIVWSCPLNYQHRPPDYRQIQLSWTGIIIILCSKLDGESAFKWTDGHYQIYYRPASLKVIFIVLTIFTNNAIAYSVFKIVVFKMSYKRGTNPSLRWSFRVFQGCKDNYF